MSVGEKRPSSTTPALSHRRIVADYLLARGLPVTHLMWPQRMEPASLTPGAVVREERVTYPAAEAEANSAG